MDYTSSRNILNCHADRFLDWYFNSRIDSYDTEDKTYCRACCEVCIVSSSICFVQIPIYIICCIPCGRFLCNPNPNIK